MRKAQSNLCKRDTKFSKSTMLDRRIVKEYILKHKIIHTEK